MIQTQYIDEYGINSMEGLLDAIRHHADIFITNNNMMLKDKKILEEKYGIKIMSPKQFMIKDKE